MGQTGHLHSELYPPPPGDQFPFSCLLQCHLVQQTIIAHLGSCNSLADLPASLSVLCFS